MITGLEQDYYCVDTPIPVTVTRVADLPVMTLKIIYAGQEVVVPSSRLWSYNGTFRLNLAPWVKLAMAEIGDSRPYTTTAVSAANNYIRSVTVQFVESSEDGTTTQTQQVTKKFVRCSQYGGRQVVETKSIKVWQCYPFSWPVGDNVTYRIPTAASFVTTLPVAQRPLTEYNSDCCQGTYIKWLNDEGNYNYWLFPRQTTDTDAEEIMRVPANIFDNPYKHSNEYTVGFEAEKTITVRDIVMKRYFHLFESLVYSPEVYVLREDWIVGTNNVQPSDWRRIIQADVNFEREHYVRSAAELEFEFTLPRPYSITDI